MDVFHAAVQDALTSKRYEPERRNKDGMRWIPHRFEIKNGISLLDVMAKDFMRPGPWAKYFAEVDKRA